MYCTSNRSGSISKQNMLDNDDTQSGLTVSQWSGYQTGTRKPWQNMGGLTASRRDLASSRRGLTDHEGLAEWAGLTESLSSREDWQRAGDNKSKQERLDNEQERIKASKQAGEACQQTKDWLTLSYESDVELTKICIDTTKFFPKRDVNRTAWNSQIK